MKIADETTYVFCPYCGQNFFIDEEKKHFSINKKITINKTIHTRHTDDAEVLKEKNKDKENKRSWIALLACVIIGFGIPFFMLAKFDIE